MKYGEQTMGIIEEARRYKSEQSLSMAAPLQGLKVTVPGHDLKSVEAFEEDLKNVTRAEAIHWESGDELTVEVIVQ